MKDWKTYALVALAAWCAWLTVRSFSPQPQTLDPEAVFTALQQFDPPRLIERSAD